MTLYALVRDGNIEVGPRTWNRSFFLDYLQEENLDFSELPRSAPTDPIITTDWKLLTVSDITYPELDSVYEQLVGPIWTIGESDITGSYSKTERNLDHIKGDLKNIVAANRYEVEVGKLEYTFSDGQIVQLYTEREERMIYLNTLQALPDGVSVPFKFKNGIFRPSVSKDELQQIVFAGMNHIASAFEWEIGKVTEIETAASIEELKAIELKNPAQVSSETIY